VKPATCTIDTFFDIAQSPQQTKRRTLPLKQQSAPIEEQRHPEIPSVIKVFAGELNDDQLPLQTQFLWKTRVSDCGEFVAKEVQPYHDTLFQKCPKNILPQGERKDAFYRDASHQLEHGMQHTLTQFAITSSSRLGLESTTLRTNDISTKVVREDFDSFSSAILTAIMMSIL
jgi:hypothetical protein